MKFRGIVRKPSYGSLTKVNYEKAVLAVTTQKRTTWIRGVMVGALVLGGGSLAVVTATLAGASTNEPIAVAKAAAAVGTATPTVETASVFDDAEGNNGDADSPIIWINPDKAEASLVIGTEKDAGLSVFDLAGKELQHIAAPAAPGADDKPGRINNVDILYDVEVGDSEQDIAIVTDRGRDQLRIFSIDPDKASAGGEALTDITDPAVPFVFSKDQAEVNTQNTAYGIAAFQQKDDALVLVSKEHTTGLGLVKLVAKGAKMSYETVRTVDMPGVFDLPDGTKFTPCEDPGEAPQSEGMVVDVATSTAYIGQEDVGLWKVPATLEAPFEPKLIDKAKEFGIPATFDAATEECVVSGADPGFGGKNLSADVEGITIYHRADGAGTLLVSSQGDSTFAAYDLKGDNAYIGSIKVGDAEGGVDGVSETDSLTVTNLPIGAFTKGLAVFADGDNTPVVNGADGQPRTNTNFKLVPFENVAAAFDPPLEIDTTGFDPRD